MTQRADLISFLSEQEGRVGVYKDLAAVRTDDNSAEPKVAEITTRFNEISLAVRAVEERLRTAGSNMAEVIREVQELEREKLKLTVKLKIHQQAEEKEIGEDTFVKEREAREVSQRLQQVVVEINEKLLEIRMTVEELREE